MKLPVLGGLLGLAGTLTAAAGSASPGNDFSNITAFGLVATAFITILVWVLRELPKRIEGLAREMSRLRQSNLTLARQQAEFGFLLATQDAQARGIRTDLQPDTEGLSRAERLYAQWVRRQERLIDELGRLGGGGEGS